MTTTAPTGTPLDLRRARHAAAGVQAWGTKAAALATLAALRDCGRNRDRSIEVHLAQTYLARFWVIGQPDHFNGVTYLMTAPGGWVPGRLTDTGPCCCRDRCAGHPVPWTAIPGAPVEPATLTHDYRYSAGQVGLSDGHGNPLMSSPGFDGRRVELTSWGASAWCIACTWSTHDDREETVRGAARYHRAHPEQYPDHTTPRRTSTLAANAA